MYPPRPSEVPRCCQVVEEIIGSKRIGGFEPSSIQYVKESPCHTPHRFPPIRRGRGSGRIQSQGLCVPHRINSLANVTRMRAACASRQSYGLAAIQKFGGSGRFAHYQRNKATRADSAVPDFRVPYASRFLAPRLRAQ